MEQGTTSPSDPPRAGDGEIQGIQFEGGGSDPLAPLAPILTWITDPSNATPGFNIDFDDSVVAGDVVTLQYATDAGFSSPTTVTHTITAPEDAANQVSLSIGALAAGTWFVRAKVAHGTHVSDWSNTVTITITASDADDYTAWLAAA